MLSSFFSVLSVILLDTDAACTNQSFCRNDYTHPRRRFYITFWNLTEAPSDIPAQALEVHLINNNIAWVQVGVFNHLSQCVKQILSRNQISVIEGGAFIGMEFLQSMHLSYNKISVLKQGMFSGVYSLNVLFQDNNEISI